MLFVWIVLGLVLFILLLGFALAFYSLHIRRQSLPQARKWQEGHYSLDFYDALEKQDYTVPSYDGYILHVQKLVNPKAEGRYVILSHGYTDNRFGALKYAKVYLDLGFHVIVYDLRGHGENKKSLCTYSVRESRDLDALARDTRARYPDARVLGIHGESLGAATTVASLKYAPPVDFAAADCGFSEIGSVMRAGLVKMHLPGVLIGLAGIFHKLLCGFRYKQMRPIDALKDSRTPILFLHGAQDDFILPSHSEAMYAAAQGEKAIRFFEGADHAASVLTAPEAYAETVKSFLEKQGIL